MEAAFAVLVLGEGKQAPAWGDAYKYLESLSDESCARIVERWLDDELVAHGLGDGDCRRRLSGVLTVVRSYWSGRVEHAARFEVDGRYLLVVGRSDWCDMEALEDADLFVFSGLAKAAGFTAGRMVRDV